MNTTFSAKVSGNKFGFDPVTQEATVECNTETQTTQGILLWASLRNNMAITIGGTSLVEANYFADVSFQPLQLDGTVVSPPPFPPFPTAVGFVNVVGNYFGKSKDNGLDCHWLIGFVKHRCQLATNRSSSTDNNLHRRGNNHNP